MSQETFSGEDSPTMSRLPDEGPQGGQSTLSGYLRSGEGVPTFPSLAPEIQADLIRAIESMAPPTQSEVLGRMRGMSIEELIGLAINPHPKAPPRVVAPPLTYTVKRGDSLSKIAREHGLGLRALIDANPQITNPNLIHPDQVITLPAY